MQNNDTLDGGKGQTYPSNPLSGCRLTVAATPGPVSRKRDCAPLYSYIVARLCEFGVKKT